jgi:ankyrin repeat protein
MNNSDPEVIVAARENNLPEISRLLRAGADIEAKTALGWTPLQLASVMGHSQVVKEFLYHGADAEAKDRSFFTPLHFACYNGHVAVVIELIGPNDSDGATSTILGKRTSRGGANIEAKTNEGDTPLHFACFKGRLAIVKALVSGGANICAANDDGHLPIHRAIHYRNSEVAKYLLQQLYATTRHLPLHELVEDITWIGSSYSSDAPRLHAAFHRNVLGLDDVVEIVEFLVDRDPAWLCSRDEDGSLPLHLACRSGASFDIVQSLVNLNKASVKSVTPQGDLPLFLACEMPETSLDTIFILVKLYPDLVYR